MTMNEIIKAVQDMGFDVYMRKPNDKFMIFAEGYNIGYLELNALEGVRVSTKHHPSKAYGTGFYVGNDLTVAGLRRAFIVAPDWVGYENGRTIKKFKGIDDYRARNTFDAEYKLVERTL